MKIKFNLLMIIFMIICLVSNDSAYGYCEGVTSNNKTIYLTFDDGPSINTDKVLDILKQYDVKATFFLIGSQIKGNEYVVKRIKNEGHGIGIHSYTHKYNIIYSSRETFINEMCETRNEINRATGISPNIIRFPGGSKGHLDVEMLHLLHDHNYKIYDWNVDSSDGINPKASPDTLFRRATDLRIKHSRIILLMHCGCVQKNTCIALPRIINFYKSQGYNFKVISENTSELYCHCK